jgi:excinuclease ABC subunit C
MISQDLKKYQLPDSPGVYLFKKNKRILYIGKATSLRDRIKSYFGDDLAQNRGPLLVDMVFQTNKVDFIKTASILEALILEAKLIKENQPKYNTKEKDNKSFNYVVITKEDFPRILIVRGREIEKGLKYLVKEKFGPFTSGEQLKLALRIVRKILPFRDKCLPNSGRPCFNKQLGLCPGVCDGSVTKKEYVKIIKNIKLFFVGKKKQIIKNLKKEMDFFVKIRNFEKAAEVRNKIFALNHIQDVALIKDENLHLTPSLSGGGNGAESPLIMGLGVFRIEAYDISHIFGTNNVGVMVVWENGEFNKFDYRKFKINNSKGNDIGALEEVLERRFKHTDWPKPNLIVVDGGLPQLNITKKVIKNISLVAVTKDDRHKAKAIIGDEKIIKKYQKEILLINNEAHRFAITYYRQKQKKMLV